MMSMTWAEQNWAAAGRRAAEPPAGQAGDAPGRDPRRYSTRRAGAGPRCERLTVSGPGQVDWQDILQPHWDATARRMREHPVVLCLQDTTELDFEGKAARGLGR